MNPTIEAKNYFREQTENLRRMLQRDLRKGKPRYYRIVVDGHEAVPRTNRLDEFDGFLGWLQPHTQRVDILLYSDDPKSFRSRTYTFTWQEQRTNTPLQEPALNGPTVEKQINESISREREKWEAQQKGKELEDTREKLKEAETYIEKLETELEAYKNKKLLWGNVNLGELASIALEGMVRRNTHLIAKIPGAEGLAGIIEQDNQDRSTGGAITPPQGEASFSKKTQADPQEQGYIVLLEQLEQCFSQDELDTVMHILEELAKTPAHLPAVAKLLGIIPPNTHRP